MVGGVGRTRPADGLRDRRHVEISGRAGTTVLRHAGDQISGPAIVVAAGRVPWDDPTARYIFSFWPDTIVNLPDPFSHTLNFTGKPGSVVPLATIPVVMCSVSPLVQDPWPGDVELTDSTDVVPVLNVTAPPERRTEESAVAVFNPLYPGTVQPLMVALPDAVDSPVHLMSDLVVT